MYVLRTVARILESKREGKTYVNVVGGSRIETSNFPDKVVIFVDELNKFVPRGGAYSSLKAPIVDIAARGRSLGLCLLGAEQMASQIDEEVLTNCSTFAVGRLHPVELSSRSYEWVKGNLRERATVLRPGQVLFYHAVHNAPVLLEFPIPLHLVE